KGPDTFFSVGTANPQMPASTTRNHGDDAPHRQPFRRRHRRRPVRPGPPPSRRGRRDPAAGAQPPAPAVADRRSARAPRPVAVVAGPRRRRVATALAEAHRDVGDDAPPADPRRRAGRGAPPPPPAGRPVAPRAVPPRR